MTQADVALLIVGAIFMFVPAFAIGYDRGKRDCLLDFQKQCKQDSDALVPRQR